MATYHDSVIKVEREDAEGNVTVDTAVITRAIRKDEEPDYVKIYIEGCASPTESRPGTGSSSWAWPCA